MSDLVWEESVALQEYNTFNIKSNARYLVRIRSASDLAQLVTWPRFQNSRQLILGGGSNMLFANEQFNGVIVKNEIKGIEVVSESDIHTCLRVGGGVEWDSLVGYCIDQDLGGLENLSLIPGTVGAAPIQNIGAYGAELGDVLLSVEVCDFGTGDMTTMTKEDCALGYRDSIFKHTPKVLMVCFITIKVTKAQFYRVRTHYALMQHALQEKGITEPTIRSVSEVVCLLRRRKLPDPTVLGNAGSFFKNVVVDQSVRNTLTQMYSDIPLISKLDGRWIIPTAWLIEKCGWKGNRTGRTGVYSDHALVLFNLGGAQGSEIWSLAEKISRDIRLKVGVLLTPEVNIVK
ncbi:hypothetical protein BDV27DRAFT_143490 [Aspergillus caelatus]|uniref:UDP-N-acetylmuramate dehydrogenase n=1 Tax=Aspergillus caelatus TaxID=61420 RepID=A0A5N7A9S7_9EURO|nr:uncharacterized protein BDV27DRAFT_143490 [Aspergillus caelatus]KAE8366627.1 hypothetical protein BDV27DRAFT_143490 [Aspergillus caelatus]